MAAVSPHISEVCGLKARHAADLLSRVDVVGVGGGLVYEAGHKTGETGLQVLVSQEVPESGLATEDLVPRTIDGIRVDVQEGGVPRLLSAMGQAHWRMTPGLTVMEAAELGWCGETRARPLASPPQR